MTLPPAPLRAPAALEPPPHVSRLVLLGHPVAHSLSPAFQNAALRAAGLPHRYAALDVAPHALDAALAALVAERAAGNVTIPHKEVVAARCDRRTPLAARVGAVNCWWCDADGALVGDNTDVGGFDAAARALLADRPAECRVAVLGAGGATLAVLAAVAGWPGARVRLWSRRGARAVEVAARFPATTEPVSRARDALAGARLVVNATPLGLQPGDDPPVPVRDLPAGCAVLDLVYRPGETRWVRDARAAGHRALDGLPMLVAQGALAFERWFGRRPDDAAMWDAVGGRPAADGGGAPG